MHLPTLFNLISLVALAVVGGVSAQDEGKGYVFKCLTPGQVALTFDDGPSPFTPKLLGYLATAKVPATFFVLGNAATEYPKALKAAFDAGHQIALHSNTHADMNAQTPDGVLSEYSINLKAVQTVIGVAPAMARPPFGNCNAACSDVLQGKMKLTIIQWNCDSNDWQYEGNAADIPKTFTNMEQIINPSNPKTDSFITLQHDIKDYSVEFVPKIIDMIKGKGYTFVTTEQCINQPAYVGVPLKAAPAAQAPVPAPAKTPAKSPVISPAAASPSPVLDAYPVVAPTSPPPQAAFAEGSKSSSSADKFTPTFGLKLVGLIFGLLMY
jgi:peptidoglycan/xylan/chitin deacetylase (PgdA/CDA1 family)